MNLKSKLTRISSLVMAAAITASVGVLPVAAEGTVSPSAIDANTTWTYSDTGVDPAGESTDRTVWTKAGYDTTGWKTAQGSFGAKKGAIADLGGSCTPKTQLTQYKEDGTTDIEAYFFRTTVNVDDPTAVTSITGTVIYDDSATVYVNGTKIAGFADSSITANMQYGGSSESAPQTGTISVTENLQNILVKGENVVAVEIHQTNASSSDIYFDMPSLTFSTEPIQEEEQTTEQGSISISMGANETQRNFTWYANEKTTGTLLVAKQSELVNGEMPESASSYTAVVKEATNKSGYYSYQATAMNLESNTTYAYQMVNGEAKTEIKTFTTGSGSSFSFAFAGDPQIGASGSTVSDTDGWEKTLSLINNSKELSNIDFMLSAGDQVNRATDETQYDGYLLHDTLQSLTVATVVGNHDSSSVAYDEHFNVPNESSYGATNASGDYYYVYNNVLFLVLNSNNRSTAEHKEFMEQAIAATANQNITWKIVTFHHSIYSVANHAAEADILERREQLSPVFKALDIDVVLMGHDHVYCRTYMMDGTTPMTDASIYDDDSYSSITNPEGILYVTANSASGSKFYTIQNNLDFSYSAVMNQERVPNISRVDVSDDQFTITTYRTSDMSVVDTFTIYHKDSYDVTVDEAENGTASADVTSTYAGETVTLTATPAEGYQFTGWTVVSGDVTIGEDNTFVMPEGNVEIKANFEHIHTYGTDWNTDEQKHWHACTEDGAVADEAEHTMTWVIDKEATAKKDGVKHQECSVCGYKTNENTVIAATGTTNSGSSNTSTSSSVKTGDNSHAVLALIILVSTGAAITFIGIRRKQH